MEYNAEVSKFDIAMERLDRIKMQLDRGIVGQKTYNTQRLIILAELVHKAINEFHNKGE